MDLKERGTALKPVLIAFASDDSAAALVDYAMITVSLVLLLLGGIQLLMTESGTQTTRTGNNLTNMSYVS